MGPPGRDGIWDPSHSPLGVYARIAIPEQAIAPDLIWQSFRSANPEIDLRQVIEFGPPWNFIAPERGMYQITASIRSADGSPNTGMLLRIVRNNQDVLVEQRFTPANGQLAWTEILNVGEVLHVEIQSLGPEPLRLTPTAPLSAITFQGVGVPS